MSNWYFIVFLGGLCLVVGLSLVHAVFRAKRVASTFRGIVRRDRGLCPACGYDLTGNVSGTCPECGRKIG
jgi:hypothetical protein